MARFLCEEKTTCIPQEESQSDQQLYCYIHSKTHFNFTQIENDHIAYETSNNNKKREKSEVKTTQSARHFVQNCIDLLMIAHN